MSNKTTTQDRKWTRQEVLELLKAQKYRCYINSGMSERVLFSELIELK